VVDLLESPVAELPLTIQLRPFQIMTLRLARAGG
jgi:hypothetical protein